MLSSKFTKGKMPSRLVRGFRRPLLDSYDAYIGSVDKESICDLNGVEIARFKRAEKNEDTFGNETETRIYHSATYGDIKIIGNSLILNDAEIGYVGRRGARFAILIVSLIALLALFLSLVYIAIDVPRRNHIDIIFTGENQTSMVKDKLDLFNSDIKPGSKGKYQFSIGNKEKKPVTYQFKLEEDFDKEKIETFPILYRLVSSLDTNESNVEWVTGSELVLDNCIIKSKEEQQFSLEWKWPFEGNNITDTLIGIDEAKYSVSLKITAKYYKES